MKVTSLHYHDADGRRRPAHLRSGCCLPQGKDNAMGLEFVQTSHRQGNGLELGMEQSGLLQGLNCHPVWQQKKASKHGSQPLSVVEESETVASITTDQDVQASMQSTIQAMSLDQRDGKTQTPSLQQWLANFARLTCNLESSEICS